MTLRWLNRLLYGLWHVSPIGCPEISPTNSGNIQHPISMVPMECGYSQQKNMVLKGGFKTERRVTGLKPSFIPFFLLPTSKHVLMLSMDCFASPKSIFTLVNAQFGHWEVSTSSNDGTHKTPMTPMVGQSSGVNSAPTQFQKIHVHTCS